MSNVSFTRRKPPKISRVKSIQPGEKVHAYTQTADIKFEKLISYRNGLPFPVTITDRSGFNVNIEPVGVLGTCNDLIIEVRYTIKSPARLNVEEFLLYLSKYNEDEYRSIMGQVDTNHSFFIADSTEYVIEYKVTSVEMESFMRSVYLEDLDILVYFTDIAERPLHPFSEKGKLAYKDLGKGSSFFYKIIINDPHNEYGDKFININGIIYRVSAIADPLKPAGVYLYNTRAVGNERYEDNVEETRYDFNDVKTYIPLYNNVEDAATLGDQAGARKRELEDMQHAHKLELGELEHNRRLEHLKHETQIAEMKRTIELKDQELRARAAYTKETFSDLERDDLYRKRMYEREKMEYEERLYREKVGREERSSFRKEIVEVLKWLPPLIIGIGTLVAKFKVVPNG